MALSAQQRERYARQLILPAIGAQGQARLAAARVSIVGVGGLGSMTALALAGAGVGHLQLIDPDPLEASNLQRQLLYREFQVGMNKAQAAAEQLRAVNSSIEVDSRDYRLNTDNKEEALSGYHVLVDGSDNFATRYLLNDYAAAAGIPWVYGAAEAMEGQLSVFWPARGSACYRCLYSSAAQASDQGCAQRGVLTMVPAIIAQLQALEVIKLLTGCAEPLLNRLLSFDAMSSQIRSSRLRPDPGCSCRHSTTLALTLPVELTQ